MRKMNSEDRPHPPSLRPDELFEAAKGLPGSLHAASLCPLKPQAPGGEFCSGRHRHPADAALMMQLGAEGVFVGSGIFKSGNPAKRAAAIVKAVTNYQDAALLASPFRGFGRSHGQHQRSLEIQLLMAERGKVKEPEP